jgi:bacterioferritin
MDKITVANELNTLLKGEQMAVEAYGKFISAVDNEKIRESLQKIQINHKEHSGQLSERIQNLGGVPDSNTGIVGVFSDMKLGMQTNGKSSYDVLKMAYDGEDKGIAAAEEIIRGDLDDTSLELAKNILSKDHDHLKVMLKLISENQLH